MEETHSDNNDSTSSAGKNTETAPLTGNLRGNDCLITTKEVINLLSISRTTLWRMNQSGALTPIKISGLSRYRLSDVNALITADEEVVS